MLEPEDGRLNPNSATVNWGRYWRSLRFSALVSVFENRGQPCVHEVVMKNKTDDA